MSKWDKWLEANGLLKYQTKDLTAAEVQQRYASVGLNVDWKSLGRPEPAQQSSQQNYAGWTAPNQPAPATATALPSQAPTVTAFSGGLQSPPPNPQDLGEAGRGSGVRIPTFEVGTGKYLGALPTSYWENPQTVVRWYNTAQANPNAALPQGMDKDTLAGIYNYMKMRNGTVPSSQWKYLSPDDPLKQYVASLPAPSDNFLLPAEKAAWGTKQNLSAQNAIVDFRASQFDWTKLSADQKHAILNNPNFHISQVIALGQQGLILGDPLFDWSKTKPFLGVIPQKWVFNALANPTTAPAAQAVFMTALTKNVPMGFGALALGYGSQIKDWGQQNNFLPGEKLGNVLEKTGQALMWGAQTVEQLQGLYMQLSGQNPKKLSILDNQPTFTPNHWADLQQEVQKAGGWDKWLEAAWEAGKNYYTTRPGAYEAVDAALSGLHELGIAKDKQAQNAVYVLGEDQPVQVRPGYTLENARQRILNGEDPGVVQADFQREYGVSGMITQLALQTIYDPLQLAHEVESAGVEKFGKLTGNAELAEAARVGKPGLMGALETYKNDYLRSGVKPLPDFSWFDHALSGINEKGEATYLRPSKAPLIQEGPFAGLHNLRGGGLSGIKDFFFSLTNNSRAGLAGEALTNHINLLVDKAGYDPEV
ncbi:MAG TPA: hypothetical protein VHM28_00225, partial [Anaerolineales bacterium]|nr:hypothetical protein [Anaerolineales bacterium]